MPFDSDKQRKFLWANKPEVARQIAYKQDGGGVYSDGTYDSAAKWHNKRLAGTPQHVGFTDDPDNITETAATNPDDPYGGKYLNPDRKAPTQGYTDLGTYYTPKEREMGRGERELMRMKIANERIKREADARGFDLGIGEGTPPPPDPNKPVEIYGESASDRINKFRKMLNPISDANASGFAPVAALATVPNVFTNLPGFQGAGAGLGGSYGQVAPRQEDLEAARRDSARFQYGRATDAEPRQAYNKGFFGGGSWAPETEEQIAQRQDEGQRSFTQNTGWSVPQQDTFLDNAFQQELTREYTHTDEDRDYWGGGEGSTDMDRTVVTDSGNLANTFTAQGDASIDALLAGDQSWSGTYDDVGSDDDDHDPWGDDWGSDPAASSPGSELDWDDSGVDWDSIYDTGPEPAPQQDDGGGDDSGGGGK